MCDSMCSLQVDRTLFAKSSDRSPAEAQVVELHPRRPAGGALATTYLHLPDPGALAVLGSRPTWQWGLEHGVNERGVAIGNEQVWTRDDPRQAPDALTGLDLVRLGLEGGATADAALEVMTELLATHGQGGIADQDAGRAYFSSFLIADATRGWILETSGSTWAARPVAPTEGGAALSNRISLGTDWTRASPDVAPGTDVDGWRLVSSPTAHADRRLAVTRAAVRAGGSEPGRRAVDEHELAGVLRDHGHGRAHPAEAGAGAGPDPLPPAVIDRLGTGVSVCLHLTGVQATTASMVASLPRLPGPAQPVRAWVALGSPCASVFIPLFPFDPAAPDAAVVPAELGRPETWARFAALRARLEAARAQDPAAADALLDVMAERWAALEDDLWAEADELAHAGPTARAGWATQLWPRIEPVLEHLGTT